MKRKIILLIGFVLLLCGCDAEVNIDIANHKINESIDINYDNVTMDVAKQSFRHYVPIYGENVIVDTMPDEEEKGIAYYKYDFKDMNGYYKINYNHVFSFIDYYKAKSVKDSFKSSYVKYDKKGKTLTLSTDKTGNLFLKQYDNLNKIKINITTPYKVLKNNADYSSGNKYTWEFEKKNNSKGIYLVLEIEDKKDDNVVEKEENDETDKVAGFMNKHIGLTICLGIVAFFVVLFLFSFYSKMRNK